jgi:Acetoacetate decarboxylase (ADC)
MASDEGKLAPMYRMPTVFGPSGGPRNLPSGREAHRYVRNATFVTVSALSDAAAIAALLPPRCRLAGEPVMTVTMSYLTKIGWLAGRGYNIAQVSFKNVVFDGDEGSVAGAFTPVLWESLADPIITGREELGFPKIYGEIPDAIVLGGVTTCSAGWQGFRFLDLTASNLVEAPRTGRSPPAASMFLKYIPKTAAWGEADVAYMTATAPGGPPPAIERIMTGTGSFRFHPARWEDMPTQYHIVSALAALPLLEFRGSEIVVSTGGGDLINQRILR